MSDPKSILVAEDSEDIRLLIADALKFQGYRVVVAADGLEAERKFKNEKFNMLITDIKMPKVDGITLIQRCREINAVELIPVIAISGNIDDFKPRLALIDDVHFLEKPFEIQTLLEKVAEVFQPPKPEPVATGDGKGRKVYLSAGEVLMKQGDIGNSMYWVMDGTLEVIVNNNGEEVMVGRVHNHELVGEMSFLDNKPRSATVKAVTDSELLEIPNGRFSEVLEDQPRWFKSLVRVLSDRIRETNKRLVDI